MHTCSPSIAVVKFCIITLGTVCQRIYVRHKYSEFVLENATWASQEQDDVVVGEDLQQSHTSYFPECRQYPAPAV